MSDGKANIVPFGKYKGRLLEEVIESDPAYLQWLSGQDWFRSRFAVLHQVIINRGSEPEETPEHNALQVQFLDDDFCLRFMRHLIPDYETQALNRFNEARTSNLKLVLEKIEEEERAPQEADVELAREFERLESWREHSKKDGWYAQRVEQLQKTYEERRTNAHKQRERERVEHVKRSTHLQSIRTCLEPNITAVNFCVRREFETRGIDVSLRISADVQWDRCIEEKERYASFWTYGWGEWESGSHWREEFNIEIKPAIGDDYPAVLRQMETNGSRYLFVGQYTGRGASREQFIKTFATASIQVVFADQVPDA